MNSTTSIVPKKGDKIYKEECVLCFRTAEKENKIWCCVNCFEGFCLEHFKLHSQKIASHNKFLIVHKRLQTDSVSMDGEDEEKQSKLVRLEIPAQKSLQYEYLYETEGPIELSQLSALIDATSCSSSNSKDASDLNGWSEPSAQMCEHSLTLYQEPVNLPCAISCGKCELSKNLWKCLTCGALSCGRRHFDGSGGNGHALEHFESCGHALAVKLGTIVVKSDGLEADVYCYKCDNLVLDSELNSHLAVLGIDPNFERKTEKSTAELVLDINLTHTYAMTDSSGSELKQLDGPWLRGLTNLGNSCYLASVIQALRNLDRDAFLARDHEYINCSNSKASECLSCQLKKLYFGLNCDECLPLRPWMLKSVAAGNNSEFLSAKQQDASEFLVHLLQNRFKRIPELFNLTKQFEIQLEEVVICGGCETRRITKSTENYLNLPTPTDCKTCSLDDLLHTRFSSEQVDWFCDGCNRSCEGTRKEARIVVLPKYLIIIANRLKLKNWVPEKTECHISGMEKPLNLEKFCGQVSESRNETENKITADPVLLGELLMMGIEEEKGRAALIACKNSSVDSAMTLIFEGEIPSETSREAIDTLMTAGFSEIKAKQALEATNGDLERAFDWIFSHSHPEEDINANVTNNGTITCIPLIPFNSVYNLSSFITHKGNSVFCGHYVVHLKDQEKWVLFNDEKVAEAAVDDESFPIKDAYIYIYKQ